MTFGLTHVIVPVQDLAIARAFYVDALEFSILDESERTVDLEAGFATIRLMKVAGTSAPVTLRLQAVSLGVVMARLVAFGNASSRGPLRGPQLEYLLEVDDPDENTLIFWRRLTEDEYDTPPPIPKTQDWTAEAQGVLQSLLSRVPEIFRDRARSHATAEAELLAGESKHVGVEVVVRAYIRATPRILRARLREPLEECGFDPDRYRSDFEF